MRLIPLATLTLSLASLAQAAPEQASFCVLKITQGEKVTYKAVPSQEAAAERKRVATDATAAKKAFKEKEAAFRKEHKSSSVPLPGLEPETCGVAMEKDGIPSEDAAETLAKDRQQKADETYVVVRIQDVYGSKTLEAIPQNQVRSREEALYAEYVEAAAKAANKDPQTTLDQGNLANEVGNLGGATGFGQVMQGMHKAPTKPVLTLLARNLPSKEKAEEALKGLKN